MSRWWIELPFAGSCLSPSKLTITEPAAILPLDTSAQMHSRLRLRHNRVSTFVGQDHYFETLRLTAKLTGLVETNLRTLLSMPKQVFIKFFEFQQRDNLC